MLHEDVSSCAQVTPTEKKSPMWGVGKKRSPEPIFWLGKRSSETGSPTGKRSPEPILFGKRSAGLRCGSANAVLSLWCGSANAVLSLWCGSANAAVSLAGRSRGHLANAALHKRSLCCRIS